MNFSLLSNSLSDFLRYQSATVWLNIVSTISSTIVWQSCSCTCVSVCVLLKFWKAEKLRSKSLSELALFEYLTFMVMVSLVSAAMASSLMG